MRLFRRLTIPASQNQTALVLAMSLLMMAMMLMALLWQSSVIDYQRDLIRVMWNWKFSG